MSNSKSFYTYALKRYKRAGGDLLKIENPWFLEVDEAARLHHESGQRFTSFAHYDYLGMNDHPELRQSVLQAVGLFGTSVGASRLVGGERSVHGQLERQLANFIGTESSLLMISGYLTNITLIQHITGPSDLIIIDDLSHNSVVIGAKGARSSVVTFRHNDVDHLEQILAEKHGQHNKTLIVIEGLYSMDGDIPDLPRIIELKNRYEAWLLVDEAHSIGVLGKNGRGLCEHFGVSPNEIELIVGTLSKTFVSSGGFIATRQEVVEWLRFTLPGFVYSVGLSPPTIGSVQAALKILEREPERVLRLQELSQYFIKKALELGLNIGQAIGAGVVPIFFKNTMQTVAVSRKLLAEGFYAPPIIQAGVPKDTPRIRFFISQKHTEAQIDQLLEIIQYTVKALNQEGTPEFAMMSLFSKKAQSLNLDVGDIQNTDDLPA